MCLCGYVGFLLSFFDVDKFSLSSQWRSPAGPGHSVMVRNSQSLAPEVRVTHYLTNSGLNSEPTSCLDFRYFWAFRAPDFSLACIIGWNVSVHTGWGISFTSIEGTGLCQLIAPPPPPPPPSPPLSLRGFPMPFEGRTEGGSLWHLRGFPCVN